MNKIKSNSIYNVVIVIIGTIIGAGFASGQEIYSFFNRYGFKGLIGIFVSVLLICYIINKTLKIVVTNNINTYKEFIGIIIPDKLKVNNILCLTINYIIIIFLLITFNIMVAGFATYFFEGFNISKTCGVIIIVILSYVVFIKNIEGVIKINIFLIPIIVLLIMVLGIKNINNIEIIKQDNNYFFLLWFFSSILYASYNSITLIPILIGLKKQIKEKREIKFIILFLVIIFGALTLIVFFLINSFKEEIKYTEMPIIYIANNMGHIYKYIYGLIILMAIFTTAIGAGYGFINNISSNKKNIKKIAIILCLSSIFLGQISFSSLINLMYPIFGFLGLLQIFFLIIY